VAATDSGSVFQVTLDHASRLIESCSHMFATAEQVADFKSAQAKAKQVQAKHREADIAEKIHYTIQGGFKQ
jgi:hypothetical protein